MHRIYTYQSNHFLTGGSTFTAFSVISDTHAMYFLDMYNMLLNCSSRQTAKPLKVYPKVSFRQRRRLLSNEWIYPILGQVKLNVCFLKKLECLFHLFDFLSFLIKIYCSQLLRKSVIKTEIGHVV